MSDVLTFDGDTYVEDLDQDRLSSQLERVFEYMSNVIGHATLFEIIKTTGGTTASVSARLRDFRKPKFGGHIVNRRRRGSGNNGIWEYQLTINADGLSADNKPTPIQIENLGHTAYEQYLASPHWMEFREGYFTRHPNKCFITGRSTAMHLHHITYVNIGKETDKDVVPLCEEMHTLVHSLNEEQQVPLRVCHLVASEVINAVLKLD